MSEFGQMLASVKLDVTLWYNTLFQSAIATPSSGCHYSDAIMGAIASQSTGLTIVYSTVYSGADQRKPQSSASLAFVQGIHRWPVNSPHKWPVTQKIKMLRYISSIRHLCQWWFTTGLWTVFNSCRLSDENISGKSKLPCQHAIMPQNCADYGPVLAH